MFTDSYAYELKSKSVIRKTFGISFIIHTLIGIMLLFAPFPKAIVPQGAEPERQFIKITTPGDFSPQSEAAALPVPPLPPAPPLNVSQPMCEITPATATKPLREIAPSVTSAAQTKEDAATQNTGLQVTPVNAKTAFDVPEVIPSGVPGGILGKTLEKAPSGNASESMGKTGQGAKEAASLDNVRDRFISALEKNKKYPYIARKQNQTGTVGLLISLDESGNLQNVQVTKSSGFSQLDNAAITLVRKICPFSHSAGKMVTMNISINYDLKG